MENWVDVFHLVAVLVLGGAVIIVSLVSRENLQERGLGRHTFLPYNFSKTPTRVFWVVFGVAIIVVELYVQLVR